MNLNEAIQHCREKVDEENRKSKYQAETSAVDDDYRLGMAHDCKECAKDHEQLAEWLEELRAYRGKIKDLIDGNLTHQGLCFYVIDIYMNAIEKEKP